MSPFFTRGRVESYLAEMARTTDTAISCWRVGQTLDLHRQLMDITVRISAHTLLGLDLDADEEMVRIGAESLRLVLSPWVLLAPWDLPGLPYRRFVDSVAFFNKRLREVIEDRRKSLDPRADILSQLIHARDSEGGLSDSEVVGMRA
jgi:cytochrome P450